MWPAIQARLSLTMATASATDCFLFPCIRIAGLSIGLSTNSPRKLRVQQVEASALLSLAGNACVRAPSFQHLCPVSACAEKVCVQQLVGQGPVAQKYMREALAGARRGHHRRDGHSEPEPGRRVAESRKSQAATAASKVLLSS